ncbi:MAG: hypothetical protein CBC65_008415 [Rhodothermaceae bacterium TMED105]|nr:MAG: hypothetical protein CBC65_008415 [Rhodothermaceae bacterium TMED105]|tara:strand:- start:2424 stop:2783 length:360 start_codon:yes stop_codon:yes gene_type:complete
MGKGTPQTTVLVITIGFIILFLFYDMDWMIYTSVIVGTLGAFSEWVARKIEWFWFKLAHILSLIFPKILLTAIFFLLLVPIARLSKWFTKDPLSLKKKEDSTFVEVENIDIKQSMERTW